MIKDIVEGGRRKKEEGHRSEGGNRELDRELPR